MNDEVNMSDSNPTNGAEIETVSNTGSSGCFESNGE